MDFYWTYENLLPTKKTQTSKVNFSSFKKKKIWVWRYFKHKRFNWMHNNEKLFCLWSFNVQQFYDEFLHYFQFVSLQVDKVNLGYNLSCFDP
jgi:hypothetical protein